MGGGGGGPGNRAVGNNDGLVGYWPSASDVCSKRRKRNYDKINDMCLLIFRV